MLVVTLSGEKPATFGVKTLKVEASFRRVRIPRPTNHPRGDSVETIDGALTTNRAVVDLPVMHTPPLRSQVFTNDPPAQPQAAVWLKISFFELR